MIHVHTRLILIMGVRALQNRDDVIANTILDIVRAANLLERLGGRYAQEADLGRVQQYMLLSMLQTEDDLSMSELRQNTLVTKQAVTGLVDRMKKGGYIKTYNDPRDHRVTRVHLTDKGKNTLQAIRPKRIEGNREAFSILSEEEIYQLSSTISKLIVHLNK